MRFTLQAVGGFDNEVALKSPHKALYTKGLSFVHRKVCGMPGCEGSPTARVLRKVTMTGVFQFFVCLEHAKPGDVPPRGKL